MANPRRDHLLHTALKLFNKHGFHATGIDAVQAASGVSKTTMYKYFKSKDELIHATLELRHKQFGDWFEGRVPELHQLRYAQDPHGALMAMFDTLTEWFHSETFYGCNFINACAEFSDQNHPIHEYSAQHKFQLADYVKGYLSDFDESVRDDLTKEIMLLIEGSIVCAHTCGLKDSADRAKKMLSMMLLGYQQAKAVA